MEPDPIKGMGAHLGVVFLPLPAGILHNRATGQGTGNSACCEDHSFPNVSPEHVSLAGKTKACPPAKEFVAFYLEQQRKRSF